MLSDEQIDHYRTFGFVVMGRYLDAKETAALGDEMDRAVQDQLVEKRTEGTRSRSGGWARLGAQAVSPESEREISSSALDPHPSHNRCEKDSDWRL